jgi:pimeloyl-ACP methyl ester carboxylesterase
MSEPETRALEVPGAVLRYDVRSGEEGTWPTLLLIGSPMGAAGFGTLAGHFTDRTVVTYDPRGAERSKRTDGAEQSTPDEHAEDLHAIISTLGAQPADIFATSGGAVNALALAARHPQDVGTLVAHEPPASSALPDSKEAIAACEAIRETYLRKGQGPAMAKFIALVSFEGQLPPGFAAQPGPDPGAFGMSAADDGSRDDPLVGQNIVTCNAYRHDFAALQAAPGRIVIGVGEESGQQLSARAAAAVADRLGTTPVSFPGGHTGFLGGEYGQTGQPDAFAATLREVLSR